MKDLRPATLWLLWFASLALLLVGLGSAPVRRTQEARVLETAREMLGEGLHGWLVPHINGRVRLEKPPLAYWLAAGSFKLFGVNDFAGRLPTVLAGWLTLGAAYLAARQLFSRRAALLGSACLFSSYYFIWHARLAETDVLAGLFVTVGIFYAWRFVAGPSDFLSANLCAIAIGLAVLSKGPPAAFIVIFFLLLTIVERRWSKLWRWIISGAPLTALAIALPWFLYVRMLPEWRVVQDELRVALTGEEHRGPFYFYFLWTLLGTAPWSGILVLALAPLIARCRRDAGLRALFCWIVAIFVPLCLAGQRQPHYLLPLMPALAILVGWMIDRAAEGDPELRGPTRITFVVTCSVVALSCFSILICGCRSRGQIQILDYILAAGAVVVGISPLIVLHRRSDLRLAAISLATGAAAAFIGMNAWWLPSLYPTSPRTAAAAIRARFGDGPYCYFGPYQSMPMVWEMRGRIPRAQTDQELLELATREPSLVAIAQAKNDIVPPPPPQGFVEREPPVMVEEQAFHLYTREGR